MAELADALDSGSSGVTPVEVQVLSAALSRESGIFYWLEVLCPARLWLVSSYLFIIRSVYSELSRRLDEFDVTPGSECLPPLSHVRRVHINAQDPLSMIEFAKDITLGPNRDGSA